MAFDFVGWLGGVASGGWIPKIPAINQPPTQQPPTQQQQTITQQPPSIFDNIYKEVVKDTTQLAAAARPYLSRDTPQQQTTFDLSNSVNYVKTTTAPAVNTLSNWASGAASGAWLPKPDEIIREPIKITEATISATQKGISDAGNNLSTLTQGTINTWLPKIETIRNTPLVDRSMGIIKSASNITPVQERGISDFIDKLSGKEPSTKPIEYEATPTYLHGNLALTNPLQYKIERALDITTGADIARAQRSADTDVYNAHLLLKPAMEDSSKFNTKFEELVKKNVLVGGTSTYDQDAKKMVYNYDTYKWADKGDHTSDITALNALSDKATASYNAYSRLQKQSEQKQADITSKTQLTTDVLNPYIGSLAKAQEDYWRNPIYSAGDSAKSLAPNQIKPATDIAIGMGTGFLTTLPYINPYVFAGTQIVPYLPSHVERLIRTPAQEAAFTSSILAGVGVGLLSQGSEILTGKNIYGEETGRRGEALGGAIALWKGGRTLEKIGIASPVKYGGMSEFATGNSITIEPPAYTKVKNKILGRESVTSTVPERIAWKGLYYESPTISLQKAIESVPMGYSPEGSLTPIIGRITPSEGASSWIQRKYTTVEKTINEGGAAKTVVETDYTKPYTPKLNLEVESPLYKPQVTKPSLLTVSTGTNAGKGSGFIEGLIDDIRNAREVISPKGKVVVGLPLELGQYIGKEGYVPDYTAMTVATPLTQKLYREAGTPQASKIFSAEMDQFKKIWQSSSKPELIKNIETSLPKTDIVPKIITERTVIYPKEIPVGQVSEWSGKLIPSDASMGKVYHHIEYPNKGVWLTESEHTLLHDIKDGKVKLSPENTAFYDKYKIQVEKNLNPKITELTEPERAAAAKELMGIIKSVDKNHTISGSLTEYLQAKVARLPKDLDMYTDKFTEMGKELGEYYKKYRGDDKVRVTNKDTGATVELYNEKTGKFDIKAVDIHSHEFGGTLGTSIGRYGIQSESPIIVGGMNLMPLREQRLRKLSATMAVGKTPEGKFYSTAMDFRRFKDIGDVLGGSTSMEATAAESIFGKRKASEMADTRQILESKISPESPISSEHKQTAAKRYEQFEPTEPTGSYTRIPLTKRYYQTADLAKGAAVVGGIGGGIAAGYLLSAPISSAFQSILGQQKQGQPDNENTPYKLSLSPTTMLVTGVIGIGGGRRKLRENMMEGGLKESALNIKPRTDIRTIEKLVGTTKDIRAGISRTSAQFRGYNPAEFEKGLTLPQESFEAITPLLKRLLPRTERDIVFLSKQFENKLIASDPLFAQKQITSLKPFDLKTNTWNAVLDIFTDPKNDIILFGSKPGDLFLEKGVGRSTKYSDIDGVMPHERMSVITDKLKKIFKSNQPGEFIIELTGNDKDLIHVTHKKTGNTIMEFHTTNEFPNIKPNAITATLPKNRNILVASQEYATRGKGAGLFEEVVLTKRAAILTAKRIKDLPDLISKYRQISADYYNKAFLEGRNTPTYNNNINTAQQAELLANAYKKYLYSNDILKSIKVSSKDIVTIRFRDALEKLINRGDLPSTTTELPPTEAFKILTEMVGNDPTILNLKSKLKTTDAYIKQIASLDPYHMEVDLERARGIVSGLKNPLDDVKKPIIKSLSSKQTIPELAEHLKPYYMPQNEPNLVTGRKTSRTNSQYPLLTDESISKYVSTPMIHVTSSRGLLPELREKSIGGGKESYPATYQKSATRSLLGGSYVKLTDYPAQTEYPQKTTYPKTDTYPKNAQYPTSIRSPELINYPKSDKYPKTTDYPITVTYPKQTPYPKTVEYPTTKPYPKSTPYPSPKPYPQTTPYPTTKIYPKTKPYPQTAPYPKPTEYPKRIPYPKTVEYPKRTPYQKQTPLPEYPRAMLFVPPIKTWGSITYKPEEPEKTKRKKARVTPKHWEYGSGANPEDVTSFIFGSTEPKAGKGKPKDLIIDRLSSGIFSTSK